MALDLDPTSLRRVVRLADRLRMGSGAPSASWTPAAKMHVTLKFVASLPEDRIAPLGTALESLVGGKDAPAACPLRLDAFPRLEQATIIVAELLDRGGELAALAARVEKVARRLGLPPEDKPFRPHLTLARLKRSYDARRWLRPDLADGAGQCRASGATLYRSELGAAGATYVPLAQFVFAQPTQEPTR
ncbi:MAG: RNA 2',3'-cyclic phosphodiesterase [Myxococcales bacterium]|nr:RNA 2',3'-cyclic phosphodiesterase [Myxococcales bacterium]